MVNTSISDIAGAIQQTPVTGKVISGILAADTYPGQYCVLDPSTGKWTKADKDTAAHRLRLGAVVVYNARVNDDNALPTIDEAVDIDNEPADDYYSLCVKGRVAVKIDDPSGTYYRGQPLGLSTTAGNLAIITGLEATGATSGTAIREIPKAYLHDKVVSGDTVAIVDLANQEDV